MIEMIKRYTVMLVGIAIAAVIGFAASGFMQSPQGSLSPLAQTAESPLLAGIVILVSMGGLSLVGVVVSRVINTAAGAFVAGSGLFVLAGQLEGVSAATAATSMAWIAIETLLWFPATLAMVLVMFRFGGGLDDVEPDSGGTSPHPFFSREALISAAAGVAVLPVVALIARTTMNGQILAAVILGAMVAGLAGRLLAPHVQPILLLASPVLFGGIGHALGGLMTTENHHVAAELNSISALCKPMPLAYVAGSLIGVSMGLGWAKSFLHHEEQPSEPRPRAAGSAVSSS